MPYGQKTGKKLRKVYNKPTTKPWSRMKAHFLDAHPDILSEFQSEKRKKWEGRINIARKEDGFKPYDKEGWKKFYRDG